MYDDFDYDFNCGFCGVNSSYKMEKCSYCKMEFCEDCGFDGSCNDCDNNSWKG